MGENSETRSARTDDILGGRLARNFCILSMTCRERPDDLLQGTLVRRILLHRDVKDVSDTPLQGTFASQRLISRPSRMAEGHDPPKGTSAVSYMWRS